MPDDHKAYKGFKGTIRAALTHHPDKFSKEACKQSSSERKKSGKLCPYAIFTAQKEKGYESHYKELPHTTKGKPEKKDENFDMSFKNYLFEEAKKKKMGASAGHLNANLSMP